MNDMTGTPLTQAQRAALRALGLTDDDIDTLKITPEEAQKLLNGGSGARDASILPPEQRPPLKGDAPEALEPQPKPDGGGLEPDRDQIEIFVQALFRHCDQDGVVSLRSFYQDDRGKAFEYKKRAPLKRWKFLIDAAVGEARRAANNPEPVVFTPPVATFKASAGWQAREEDLLEGPVLSVELDENPRAALAKLEQLLGPATLVVRSGGQWTNPTTGEVEDKLHAYWRLKKPARGEERLGKLKELRRLATELVSADRSNIPINHPIRWPGSWHRKSTPRLCEIVSTEHIDNEIDLDVALKILQEATNDLPLAPVGPSEGTNGNSGFEVPPGLEDIPFERLGGDPYPKTAEPARIAAALAVIPNSKRLLVLRGLKIDGSEDDGLDWHSWCSIGLATWRGTDGSKEGFAIFQTWSRKWPKYIAGTEAEKARFDRTTAERWEAFSKCPPTKIGIGTIFFLADKASPGWREEYEARSGGSAGQQGDGGQGVGGAGADGGGGGGGGAGGGGQAGSGAGQQGEGEQNDGTALGYSWHLIWHGEVDPTSARKWLVQDLLPETGVALISGQWGTYKTFVADDLSAAVMTGTTFVNRQVMRKGGVLFLACEGYNEVDIRLTAAFRKHDGTGNAPFAWVQGSPRLLKPNAAKILAAMVKHAAIKMMQDFGLPVAMVVIDTAGKAAGLSKPGELNDDAVAKVIMNTLAEASTQTGALFVGVAHFGKNVETGTKGSTGFEDDADVVLALLGERGINGIVNNPILCARKRKSGPNGEEFSFQTEEAEIGPEKTLTIRWAKADAAAAAKPKKKDDPWAAKSLRHLRATMTNMLADCGSEQRPYPDGPIVKAVDIEIVRAEFYKSYPAHGDETAKRDARRKAFNRAISIAHDKRLIGTRDIEGTTFVWPATPE